MQLLTVKNIHTHDGFTPGYFIFKLSETPRTFVCQIHLFQS